MYGYEWTDEYGIFRLTVNDNLKKEIRPVFHEELDFLGMDDFWDYPKDTDAPIMWAEGTRKYVLNGSCIAVVEGGGFYSKPVVSRLTDERLQLKPVDIHRLSEVNYPLMRSIEQNSIDFIQLQHEKYSKEGYRFVCAFSGGKDSLTLLDLCSKALAPSDFYVVFSNTGMELSDTIKAVEMAKQTWPDLQFEEAKCHMNPKESWELFGPPSNRIRWCCSVHKSVPSALLIKQLAGERTKIVVYDGVRGNESARRAKYTEVGEGVKNAIQVNCHAILGWSSAEVFIYLLSSNIMLNQAYRYGICRVGCKVCPMSSKWQDAFISNIYPDEVSEELSILEEMTVYAKGKLDKNYIEDGKWQARVGGKVIKQGENRVEEVIEGDKITFTLSNYQQEWKDVATIFGNLVEESHGDMKFQTKNGVSNVTYRSDEKEMTVSIYPYSKLDRFEIASLRAIANKAAYCIGCKNCVTQCKTNAFQIIDRKIHVREELCVHCYNCCANVDRGCLVAKSLYIRSDTMKNPDRYRNFGFRQEFYSHFAEHGLGCFDMGVLGKDQYRSLRNWLGDAGVLKKVEKRGTEQVILELTQLGEKLLQMNPYDPLVWAVLWSNLAYESVVAKTFCLNVKAGEMYEKEDLVEFLSHEFSEKARSQAVNSLLSTFRDSPIGSALKQGIQVDKTYVRFGWDYPQAVALLYALYLYAEKTGHYRFTFTELTKPNCDIDDAISPHDIFGIDVVAFKNHVQGLAIGFPEYIHVSFVENLDNIILEEYSSVDILDLSDE